MSVLIKGMEMPKDCSECNFMYTTYMLNRHVCLAGDVFEIKVNSGIDVNCPLIEVQEPHGRLIDADAYCEDLLKEAHKVWRLLKLETIERINRTVDDLKKYPAIIEAEGVRTNE